MVLDRAGAAIVAERSRLAVNRNARFDRQGSIAAVVVDCVVAAVTEHDVATAGQHLRSIAAGADVQPGVR